MLDYCFNHLGLHKVIAHVTESNAAVIPFHEEGRRIAARHDAPRSRLPARSSKAASHCRIYQRRIPRALPDGEAYEAVENTRLPRSTLFHGEAPIG